MIRPSQMKYSDRHFKTRGYYVESVENINEESVRKYI